MASRAHGVVLPKPINPCAFTSRCGVDVPWSETVKTLVDDACCSIANVPHGEVVPTPTKPVSVSPIVLLLVTMKEVSVEEPTEN